jgi:hypothetical protein
MGVAVSHVRGHYVDRHAAVQQQRDAGVAQVVRAEPGDTRVLAGARERLAQVGLDAPAAGTPVPIRPGVLPDRPREAATVMPGNAEGPDTDVWPDHRERQYHHITEGRAFASERSADAGTPRRCGDLVPAGQLLVPVLRELFARADALVGGDA